jgi:hypothetical protein
VLRDNGLDHRVAALFFPDIERVHNVALATEILYLFLSLLKRFETSGGKDWEVGGGWSQMF